MLCGLRWHIHSYTLLKIDKILKMKQKSRSIRTKGNHCTENTLILVKIDMWNQIHNLLLIGKLHDLKPFWRSPTLIYPIWLGSRLSQPSKTSSQTLLVYESFHAEKDKHIQAKWLRNLRLFDNFETLLAMLSY